MLNIYSDLLACRRIENTYVSFEFHKVTKINNCCFYIYLMSIYIFIKSLSTYKETAIPCSTEARGGISENRDINFVCNMLSYH